VTALDPPANPINGETGTGLSMLDSGLQFGDG
jgi:hypothetical protein